MESQKTQVQDTSSQLKESSDGSVTSNEQHKTPKKSPKLRPFALMGS